MFEDFLLPWRLPSILMAQGWIETHFYPTEDLGVEVVSELNEESSGRMVSSLSNHGP